MSRKTIDIFAVLLLAVLVSGCRLKRPDDVLSPKKMENILYDYHLAQSVAQEMPRDERYKTDAYVNWVYEKHNITKSDFDRSLKWYCRYPKEFAKIYKHISNRVDAEYKSVSKYLSQIEKKSYNLESGDSIDMWYLDKTALLNTSVLMDKISFQILRDTTFYNGDTIQWTMNGTFLNPDSTALQQAYMYIALYSGENVTVADTVLTSSGCVDLKLLLEDASKLTSIRGFVNYSDTTDNRSAILVLTDICLNRYHVKKVSDTTPSKL